MARKEARKRAVKKHGWEQGLDDFVEEVSCFGRKFGKRAHERRMKRMRDGEACGWHGRHHWLWKPFGVFGPFISSIVGIVVLAILSWVIDFAAVRTDIQLLFHINAFLLANMGIFFLLLLFFSYSSYCRRIYPRKCLFFLPVVIAAKATVFFWILANALFIANVYVRSAIVSRTAFLFNDNLSTVFVFFFVIGYLVLFFRMRRFCRKK
jgi:hypothetical protein